MSTFILPFLGTGEIIGLVSITSYVKSESSHFLPLPVSSVPSVFSFGFFVSYSTFGFGGLGGFVSLQNYPPPYLAEISSMSSIFFWFRLRCRATFRCCRCIRFICFRRRCYIFSLYSHPYLVQEWPHTLV